MQIVKDSIGIGQIKEMSAKFFGDMVKAVVDIEREIIAVDAELHSDLEALLLADASMQSALWGVNFYPELLGDEFVEFDSLINIRPAEGNRSRSVENENIRKKILDVVGKKVTR